MNSSRALTTTMRTILVLITTLLPARAWAQLHHLEIEREGETTSFPITRIDTHLLLPLEVLSAIGATIEEGDLEIRAIIAGDTLQFQRYSPIFHDRGRTYQLVAPVQPHEGKTYLPAQLFTEWLPNSRPEHFALEGQRLRVSTTNGRTSTRRSAGKTTTKDEPRVVILDPGHGGRDPGNIGWGGIREKDLTLSIALRLAERLREKGGYEVHLTRTTDTAVPLAERPRMANRWKANRPAALFLSIHINSFERPNARGFETFFLSEARTEDERRVAEMENSAIEYEDDPEEIPPLDDLDWIFSTLRNDFYIRASHDLAATIQDHFANFHPGPNRGVKQAGFRVLVGAFMPAALVELGFFSNPDEARLLNDGNFQRQLIGGLASAIDHFFDSHEHLWIAEVER